MPRLTTQALLSLILTATLTPGWAAGPAIGVVIAPGTFRLDGAAVTGNATLVDGAAVETAQSSSRLEVGLEGGKAARVELSPGSRARVHAKFAALEKGSGELASSRGYQIEARTLRIQPRDSKALARVELRGASTVLVAAVNGPVRVFNKDGLVVADVFAGMAMSFIPQAGPANGSKLAGCLVKNGTAYLLTDDASQVTVELRGDGLEENVGKKVEITGTAFRSAEPVAGASSVIHVDTLTPGTGSCVVPPGGVAPASPSTGPVAKSGGLSNGAKVAIAVAVAGGAAGGIIAATSKGSKSPQ